MRAAAGDRRHRRHRVDAAHERDGRPDADPPRGVAASRIARPSPQPLAPVAAASRRGVDDIGWLRDLPPEVARRVRSDIQLRPFRSGEVVARKGASSDHWIGVADGLLKISAVFRSGKVVMFSGIPTGSWVGEGSVLKREIRRYDIVAMRDSLVYLMPAATFRWLLDVDLAFSHLVISRLNERLGQFIAIMEIDRMSDPVARVARTIAILYNPILNPELGAILNLSQSDLGEFCGMSRQSIGAALKQLEREELVSMGYGGLVVRNVHALATYEEREVA